MVKPDDLSIPLIQIFFIENDNFHELNLDIANFFSDKLEPCQEPVAQLVEHLTFNQGVPGSSPGGLTTLSQKYYHIITKKYHVIVCLRMQ